VKASTHSDAGRMKIHLTLAARRIREKKKGRN